VTNGGVTEDVSQPEVVADVTEVLSVVSSKDDKGARNISIEWHPRTVVDSRARAQRVRRIFNASERVRLCRVILFPRCFVTPLLYGERFPRGRLPRSSRLDAKR